jgi:hypothetical protein
VTCEFCSASYRFAPDEVRPAQAATSEESTQTKPAP